MNKIVRLGSSFFTLALIVYAAIKYSSGNGESAIYYVIAAIGFALIALSYWKREYKK